MANLEVLVIALNLIIVLASYFLLYPKLAGKNFHRIAFFDLLSSGFALGLVASKFWQTGQVFNLLGVELNWFWFTLITYAIIEIPVSMHYFKKYKVDTKF